MSVARDAEGTLERIILERHLDDQSKSLELLGRAFFLSDLSQSKRRTTREGGVS